VVPQDQLAEGLLVAGGGSIDQPAFFCVAFGRRRRFRDAHSSSL